MAKSPRSDPPNKASWWSGVAAALLLLAAPFAYFQAAANSGLDAPRWARAWNGFRLAEEARGRLSGDPQKPEAGLTLGPRAEALARAAYAREPLASNALFVLALAQSPLTDNYRAGTIARQGAALDRRHGLLQLLLVADAAAREDFDDLFAHADLLAAAHPDLAQVVLAPLFDRLGDPEVLPLVERALAGKLRWAAAFKRTVPQDTAALRNYLTLRREAGLGVQWESDGALVGALADNGLYDDAFALWRGIVGGDADRFGFVADAAYAPIGWRLASGGEGAARIGEDGTMFVWLQRGADAVLARQLLALPPGRYRLETRIESPNADPPLTIALHCATASVAPGQTRPLAARTDFVVNAGSCPAYWLVLGGSALDSRHDLEATLGNWRFSRIS